MDEVFAQLERLERETPKDPLESLVHIRALYQRLSELAVDDAEEKWPGFESLTKRLIKKESDIQRGRA